jgi:ABC-2 type transport system ATP-binding protein
MTNLAIEVSNLRKTYGSFVAVNDLSFHVARGEIFGLLGPNGAGKTTTIRILMDIIQADGGTVCVLGEAPGVARKRVGYLPEERGLYRGLKVEECLVYLGQLKGLDKQLAEERAAWWLRRVELSEWAQKKVQDLSRGMQQKVQLVASIIHEPELIIVDEPFQGLDPVNAELIRSIIRELRDRGKTIILSAHEMSLVEMLCERIALIHRGQIVLNGALSDLKKQFAPNALHIRPPQAFDGWLGVTRTELRDGQQTVYLSNDTNPRAFLQKILAQNLPIEQFEVATATLDQIFVTVVKGNE